MSQTKKILNHMRYLGTLSYGTAMYHTTPNTLIATDVNGGLTSGELIKLFVAFRAESTSSAYVDLEGSWDGHCTIEVGHTTYVVMPPKRSVGWVIHNRIEEINGAQRMAIVTGTRNGQRTMEVYYEKPADTSS